MSKNLIVKSKPDKIDNLVSGRLKTRRILRGVSHQDLGKAVNVSIQQIRKYEKATNRIPCGKLYGFAQFLKVPIAYFFEGVEDADHAASPARFAQNKDWCDASEKDLLTLVRSFNGMRDSSIRKQILSLVKTMSGTQAA